MTDNPFTVKLVKIQANSKEDGFAEITFTVANPSGDLFDVTVAVNPKSFEEDDWLRQGRHYFHNMMRAVADRTAEWRIPKPDEVQKTDT